MRNAGWLVTIRRTEVQPEVQPWPISGIARRRSKETLGRNSTWAFATGPALA